MKIKAAIILLLLPAVTIAQKMDVYVSMIAGQYRMADMKKFQRDNVEQTKSYPAPLKSELSFPASLQAEVGMNFSVSDKMKVGWFANYAVTKGQVGYADYSGFNKGMQNLDRFSLGGRIAALLPAGFEVYGKLGLGYSRLKLDYETNVSGNPPTSSVDNFHSHSALAEPGIAWSHRLHRFYFRASIGYEVDIAGQATLNGTTAWLVTDDNKKVHVDWSGLRAGLSTGFKIF